MLQADKAFILHRDIMSDNQIREAQAFLNKMEKAGVLEMMTVNETATKRAKALKAGHGSRDYSDEFIEFWGMLDSGKRGHRIAKPKANRAFEKAIDRGHSAATILKAVPGWLAEEAERLKDYYARPCHPASWLNDDRFLDWNPNNMDLPKRSQTDMIVDEIEKVIDFPIENANRMTMLMLLNDGDVTREDLERAAGRFDKNVDFMDWLRDVVSDNLASVEQ